MFVEIRHDVFTAVYGGRGAILVELRDAMTAEPGHIVFVDNFGMSRVVVVVNENISDSQKQKVKKALAAGTQFSLRLFHEDLVGNDVIAVTQSQLNRLKKAHEAGKGVTIKMSMSQVAHNMKIQGGFLPLLAGLASQALPFLTGTVLPALGVGALSGLAPSTGIQKLVGDGLYIKKGGCVCEVETDGRRLYLEPTTGKGFSKLGDGLYHR